MGHVIRNGVVEHLDDITIHALSSAELHALGVDTKAPGGAPPPGPNDVLLGKGGMASAAAQEATATASAMSHQHRNLRFPLLALPLFDDRHRSPVGGEFGFKCSSALTPQPPADPTPHRPTDPPTRRSY